LRDRIVGILINDFKGLMRE
jgi:hypothetical protein